MGWLVHGDNIDGKIASDYKGLGPRFREFRASAYLPYKEEQLRVTGVTKTDIERKTELYDGYSRKVDQLIGETGKRITSQSKFRPTVLEEFCGFLFKDVPAVQQLDLDFYKKDVYAGLRIDSGGTVEVETRDIDFCIAKRVAASIGANTRQITIPVVAVECKTYLDKTMLSGAQFTALRLKGGSPRVKVLMVSEENQVDTEEIPTDSPIDQIYILRAARNEPIDPDVVWDFFHEVSFALDAATRRQTPTLPGRLLSG